MQAMIMSPLNVAHNALKSLHMFVMRIIHKKTDLLHNISNVGPGESKILKPCKTTIMRGILIKSASMSTQFGLGIHRNRRGFT